MAWYGLLWIIAATVLFAFALEYPAIALTVGLAVGAMWFVADRTR